MFKPRNKFERSTDFLYYGVTMSSWDAYWKSEKSAQASERGRKNRGSTGGAGSKHTTGFIGFGEHYARMKKTYGTELKFTDVFASTHSTTNEHGTQWVDSMAKATFELYRTSVAPEVQEASKLPWKPDVWVDVTKHGRKTRGQRLYGFGNHGASVIFPPEEVSECTPSTTSQVRATQSPPPEVVQLTERVQQAESLCEELRSENTKIHEKLDTLISTLQSSSTAPPHSGT